MHEKNWKTGDFCWIDLDTTMPLKAKEFYSDVFGWEYGTMDSPNGNYYISKLPEGDVGGISQLPEDQMKQGIPSHWNTYVLVDDIDLMAKRSTELGGKVILEPIEMMDEGRLAVISSPSGAAVSMWQNLKSEEAPRTSGMSHGMY